MADIESYAHETVNVALDALRQVRISGSLGNAHDIAIQALSHLEGRRTALIALSQAQEVRR